MEEELYGQLFSSYVEKATVEKLKIYEQLHFLPFDNEGSRVFESVEEKEILIDIISFINALIDKLYTYGFKEDFISLSFEDKIFIKEHIFEIEKYFIFYLLKKEQNYVIPLLKARDMTLEILSKNNRPKYNIIFILIVMSELKTNLLGLNDSELSEKNIYTSYLDFLSISFLLLAEIALEADLEKFMEIYGGSLNDNI